MLKWLFRIKKANVECKPCEKAINPELQCIKTNIGQMNKDINERIDKLIATINGDTEWFLKINRGQRHDNT